MRIAILPALSLLMASVLAGCLSGGDDSEGEDIVDELPGDVYIDGQLLTELETPVGHLEAKAAAGSISEITLDSAATITVADNVFLMVDNRFVADKSIQAEAGQSVRFLVPPGMAEVSLDIDGEAVVVPSPDTGQGLFDGHNIVEWYKVQRDEYPNRCNGCENYIRSQSYFAELFESFGVAEVEVDPYGQNMVHAEFANVVAYKYPKIDASHALWLGVGGHYDAVTSTREAAFDDTSGTLATLELARALQGIETNHNIVYGLWGGEEAGLQGSNFFVKTNPNVAAQMSLYVNLDVVGFSWPAPLPVVADPDAGIEADCSALPVRNNDAPYWCPDPVVISAGPDGPVAEGLLAAGRLVQSNIMEGYPDEYFLLEPIVQGGQVGGYAGVNAQSDHTSFIAGGVPSYFLFNGNALKNPIGIHNQRDTIDNWTKYVQQSMLVDLEANLTAEQQALGEDLIAESFETYLWLTFYLFLLVDLGLMDPHLDGAA